MTTRVAWFTASRAGTVSRYCTEALLPLLERSFDITIFGDGGTLTEGLPTEHYLSAVNRHRDVPFDIFFYQIEDDRSGDASRLHVGLMPGIVWFHDFLLGTDGPEPILNSPWRDVAHCFRDPSVGWPDRMKIHYRRDPRALREASTSIVSLFNNERAHREFLQEPFPTCFPRAGSSHPVAYTLPVPVRPVPLASRDGEPRVLVCGSPRLEHRVHLILRAIEDHGARPTLVWLLNPSERAEAEELCREYPTARVEFHEGRTPERWSSLLVDCTVACHLLLSSIGHLSPYLEMSLMAGTPTVVLNFGGPENLHGSVVYKIDPGHEEAAQLETVLRVLLYRDHVPGSAPRDFAFEQFHVEKVAHELASIFARHAALSRTALNGWSAFQRSARAELLNEVARFSGDSSLVGFAPWEDLLAPVMEELQWR